MRLSSRTGAGTDWTLNATARVVDGRFTPGGDDAAPAAGDLVTGDALYAALAERGLRYGPAFRGIVEVRVGSGRATAMVESPARAGDGHLAHPAVTDAALQCMAALLATDADAPDGPVVPASIRSARRFAAFTDRVQVTVRRSERPGLWADITIRRDDGQVALELDGVEFRPVRPRSGAARFEGMFYEQVWGLCDPRDPADLAEAGAEAMVVVALGQPASPLAGKLAAVGDGTRLVELPGDAAALLDGEVAAAPVTAAVRAALAQPGARPVLVAVVAGDDTGPGTASVAGLLAVARALRAARPEPADAPERPLHAVVVTRRAFVVPGDLAPPDLAHSALVGVRRELRNEQPDVTWRLVDVDDDITAAGLRLELLVSGRYAGDGVDEVAVRAGLRSALRMRRTLAQRREEAEAPRPLPEPERNARLEAPASRRMADLALRETERVPPGPGQVEVRIGTVGVSYKDALKVIGVLTDEQTAGTFFGSSLGMEAQGTVVRVGPDVTAFAVGDRVVVADRDLAARYVTLRVGPGEFVGHAPRPWSAVGAASLVVFFTAHHALVTAARVREGETVLIHGAAGGVGLAGIQVARRLGARIIATAGTPERRAVALDAGADHVLDSRSLNFVEEVRALTGGRGADVVLSSAPGEVAVGNLAAAAEFGRVVEVGKGGIYTNTVLPMAPFDRNLTFVAMDIDRMIATRREMFAELMYTVLDAFDRGDYVELPTTAFPAGRAAEALDCVLRAGQVGRVALTFDEEAPTVVPPRRGAGITADATYLVTGGFGAFGLATARWLVAEGARNLVLAGRHGARTDEARTAVAELAAAGAQVHPVALDVADHAAVTALVADVTATMPPLRGVFHAAGVLSDRPFGEIDAASLESVMAPKAQGALNLHAAVAGLPLDHFVLYSSGAAIIGNMPQASYCAANFVLDTLAQARRAAGLPGLSVNWGSLAGGMAESTEEIRRYLSAIGLTPIPFPTATEALGECLALDLTHVGLIDLDWTRWAATHPASAGTPRVVDLVAEAGTGGSQAAGLRAELAKLPEDQRVDVLGYVLAEQLSEVLGLPADALDLTTPLPELGLDSLMAVDLGARLSLSLGVEVSAMEFSRGLGLAGLARKILPTLAAPVAG